jgi:hypothetical protein
MAKDRWLVSLNVKITVQDAGSRENAVNEAIRQVREKIVAGDTFPLQADARKLSYLLEEEPIFGIRW